MKQSRKLKQVNACPTSRLDLSLVLTSRTRKVIRASHLLSAGSPYQMAASPGVPRTIESVSCRSVVPRRRSWLLPRSTHRPRLKIRHRRLQDGQSRGEAASILSWNTAVRAALAASGAVSRPSSSRSGSTTSKPVQQSVGPNLRPLSLPFSPIDSRSNSPRGDLGNWLRECR